MLEVTWIRRMRMLLLSIVDMFDDRIPHVEIRTKVPDPVPSLRHCDEHSPVCRCMREAHPGSWEVDSIREDRMR